LKQLLAEFKITDSLRFNLLDYSINACQTVTDRQTLFTGACACVRTHVVVFVRVREREKD
jgi:hypothetical protein